MPLDESDKAKAYTVTASSLNVRSTASTSGKILGVVKRGAVLIPNGKKATGWAGVTYNGADSWVSSKYVREG